MKHITLVLLIFSTVITIPIISDANAQSDSGVIIQGYLAEVHGISQNNEHVSKYLIDTIEEDGTITSIRISFDTVPSNIQNLLGKKIIAQGFEPNASAKTINDLSSPISIHTIKLVDNTPKFSVLNDPIPALGSGTQNIVTLMVKYSDVSETTHTRADVQDLIYDATDSLNQLYQTVSYDNFGIAATTVEDWAILDKNRASYAAGGQGAGLNLIAADAMAAHPSINYNSVDGIIIVVNGCITSFCFAWGDVATRPYTGPPGQGTIFTRISWMPDTTSLDARGDWSIGRGSQNGLGVLGHEVGHNQGFAHTTPPNGLWASGATYSTYTDMWSIMSTNWDNVGPSPFVVSQRSDVGWIPALNKVNIPIGTQSTITLDFANEPLSGSNKKMATVPLPDGTKLILGAYKDGLFSDTPNNNEGIVMHRFYPGGNQIPQLDNSFGDRNNPLVLVATAGTGTFTDLVNANLDVDDTWNGPNGVIIRIDSKTTTSITASISNGAGPLIGPCGIVDNTDWVITSDCTLTASVVADKNITIQNNAVLTIPAGKSITFDSANFSLIVKSGSGLLIKSGATLAKTPPTPTSSVSIPSSSGVLGCETTNTCYSPYHIIIPTGTTVTWTNGVTAHTVTSGTVDGFTPSPDGTFDSSILFQDDSFEWTPDTAGDYPYYCALHTWMTGVVSVYTP